MVRLTKSFLSNYDSFSFNADPMSTLIFIGGCTICVQIEGMISLSLCISVMHPLRVIRVTLSTAVNVMITLSDPDYLSKTDPPSW